ncbi:MAG: sulfur oxidation c-type cytochrome SoxX [Hyphomicrobiaceae bacterium]
MRIKGLLVAVLATVSTATSVAAQPVAKADPAVVAKYIKETFKSAPADWQARIEPDEAQKTCSVYRNNLPQAEFEKAQAREKANVVMPADGNVMGDWKAGEKLAQRGTGGQFTDKPDTFKGGNCYACHQLDRKELSYGTLGPSLTEYGKIRKFAPDEAKAAYAKIYNAQAVLPCSNMPRFGHNKFLSEKDMKDLTAYLFDPASPVNK